MNSKTSLNMAAFPSAPPQEQSVAARSNGNALAQGRVSFGAVEFLSRRFPVENSPDGSGQVVVLFGNGVVAYCGDEAALLADILATLDPVRRGYFVAGLVFANGGARGREAA